MRRLFRILSILLLFHVSTAVAETHQGDPTDYLSIVPNLQPGDTLELAAGDYTGRLNVRLHGSPDAWITIKGPETGAPARFLSDPNANNNTIEIREASYVALENLTIDGQGVVGVFGISSAGSNTHHIRIENCTIVGHGGSQQTVGISTKSTTWGWIIRRNRIVAAGTGMYLGTSGGGGPFIGGLIEYNLFDDSKGYNTQIKHQTSRPDVPGVPTTPQKTIIRHNVFIKTNTLGADSGSRPNLLLGHFPGSGNGSQDMYEVYGNLFYHNYSESLMQAEGRLAIHDNIFVDTTGTALYLSDHNRTLDIAYVYNNTFYAVDRGIRFASPARVAHSVVGNVIFGDEGVTGNVTNTSDNIVAAASEAGTYVANPSTVLGEMDFYPRTGQLEGTPLDLSAFTSHTDYNLDFGGSPKGTATFRGAYAGSGTNPGWQLTDQNKGSTGGSTDTTPPTGTVQVEGGGTTTPDLLIDLTVSATDSESGMGAGAQMSFSNNGTTWSPGEPYASTKSDWDLSDFGGNAEPGMKTVHARFRDAAGNWSDATAALSIEFTPAAAPPQPEGSGGCVLAPGGGSPIDFLATLLLAAPFFVLLRRRSRA